MVIHDIKITLYLTAGFFPDHTSFKIVASLASLSLGAVLACTLGFVGGKAFEFFAGWANITTADPIVEEFITGKIRTLR